MNKKIILKNLSGYTAQDIAKFIHDGIVTSDELLHNTNGQYTPIMKFQVEKILDNWIDEEPNEQEPIIDNEESKFVPAVSEEFSDTVEPTSYNKVNEEKEPVFTADASKPMFRAPFSFKGRIRRTEYGLTIIIIYVIYWLITGIFSFENGGLSDAGSVLFLILVIISTWVQLAQSTKRCHDIGHSGWWQLIPFYGFWLLFDKGDGRDPNEYGPSAK